LNPGISSGREPVASTTLLAMIVWSPVLVLTVMRWPSGPGLPSVAVPSTISTPLPFSSVRTPPVSLLTTPPFQVCIFFMSSVGLATVMPMSSTWPSFSNVLAAWITAFDGMQPTLRQTPPMYSRSMMQVLTFSWPSRIAAG
jgi:hypothetical protein